MREQMFSFSHGGALTRDIFGSVKCKFICLFYCGVFRKSCTLKYSLSLMTGTRKFECWDLSLAISFLYSLNKRVKAVTLY